MRLPQREARRQQQQQQQVSTILVSNPSSPTRRKTKSRSNNVLKFLQSALFLCIALVVLIPAVFHPQLIRQDRYHHHGIQSSSSNRSEYSELDASGNIPPPTKQPRTRTGTRQQDDQKHSTETTTTTPKTSTTVSTSSNQEPHQQHHSYCHYHDYHNFNYRHPLYTLEDPNEGTSSSSIPSSSLPLPLPPTAHGKWPLQVGLVTTKARQMRLTSKHVLHDGIQGSNYLTLVTICELSTGLDCGTNNDDSAEEEDSESPKDDNNNYNSSNNYNASLPSSRNDIDLWIIDVVTIRKMGDKLLDNEIFLDLIRQSSTLPLSPSSPTGMPSWTTLRQKQQQQQQQIQPPRLLFLDYSDQVSLQPPIGSNPQSHDGPAFYRKLGIHFYYNASMTTTTTTEHEPPASSLEDEDEEEDLDQEEEEEDENEPEEEGEDENEMEEEEGDENEQEEEEGDENEMEEEEEGENEQEEEEGDENELEEDVDMDTNTTLDTAIAPPIPPQPYIRIALSSVVQGRWYHKKTKTIHIGRLYNPDQIRIGGGPPLHAPYAVRLDIVMAMYEVLPTVVAATTKERLLVQQRQQREGDADDGERETENREKEYSVTLSRQGGLQEPSEESPNGENTEERDRNPRQTTKKTKGSKVATKQQRNHPHHRLQLSPALDTVRTLDVIHLWDLSGSRNFNRHAGSYRDEVSRVIHAMNGTRLGPVVPTTTTTRARTPRPRTISTSTEFRGKSGTSGRNKANYDYVTALLTTKIVVVVMRDMWEDHYRLLEAISCGALVLTDHMLALQNMGFVPGQSIAVFDNTTHLQELIHYYLQQDTERVEIAHESWKIALGRHLPWHRLEEVLFGCPLTKVDQPYMFYGKNR